MMQAAETHSIGHCSTELCIWYDPGHGPNPTHISKDQCSPTTPIHKRKRKIVNHYDATRHLTFAGAGHQLPGYPDSWLQGYKATHRISMSLKATKSLWIRLSTSTSPHGYWRPRTFFPPISITLSLPTTANGTRSCEEVHYIRHMGSTGYWLLVIRSNDRSLCHTKTYTADY